MRKLMYVSPVRSPICVGISPESQKQVRVRFTTLMCLSPYGFGSEKVPRKFRESYSHRKRRYSGEILAIELVRVKAKIREPRE